MDGGCKTSDNLGINSMVQTLFRNRHSFRAPYTVHSTGSIFYKNMFCLLVSSKPMEYKVWPIHSGCTDVY